MITFDPIEPGMYRVHYLARVDRCVRGAPTRIEATYAPEVYRRTAASALAVRATP